MHLMDQFNSPKFRRSRALIVVEATLEYFIYLCVTSTCLTAILTQMDVSSSMQGIINAITSLACSIQLLAVFCVKKTYPCKRWVSILNLFNQLLFAVLYLIPSFDFSKDVKVGIFIALLFITYACQHYLTPSRVNWQMALVADNRRGIFTANKEIVSLFSGMLISQSAGIMLDYFEEKGDMQTCFFIFAITITVLAILHLVSMLTMHEPQPETIVPPKKISEIIKVVFGSSDLRKVLSFDALFSVANIALNFVSIYLVATFGVPYTYITAVGLASSLCRALVSRYLGRLADRKSWAYMLRICMVVDAIGFLIFAIGSAQTILWIFPIYSLCHGFSLGGSNAGRSNLCLDYIKHENRRYILGIQYAISGVISFLATLVASAFVDHVESNGNTVFGISVYPQQVLLVIGGILLLILAFGFLPFLKKPDRFSNMEAEK